MISAVQGSSVELGCAAQGFPIPSYSWSRNSMSLTTNSITEFTSSSSSSSMLDRNKQITQIDGSLRFRQVSLLDAGLYQCLVNNSIGSEMMETQLIVIGELKV